MSVITDINLHLGTNFYDAEAMVYVNSFEYGDGYGSLKRSPMTVADLRKQAGGQKVYCHKFLIGSYNHFDLGGYVEYLRAYDWHYPTDWRLVSQGEFSDTVDVFWQDGEKWSGQRR